MGEPKLMARLVVLLAVGLIVLAAVGAGEVACAYALPSGRTYEMVTPPFKGGYGAALLAESPDGERLVFTSIGAFGDIPLPTTGNAYVAHRVEGSGWVTHALEPPFFESQASEFSASVESTVTAVVGQGEPGEIVGRGEIEYLLHDLEAPDTPEWWEPFGEIAVSIGETTGTKRIGSSGDLCHLVLEGSHLLPEAPVNQRQLYDLSRSCGERPGAFRLVAVKNGSTAGGASQPLGRCSVMLGGGEALTSFNAISGDGREVFFQVSVEPGSVCPGSAHQVFVRLDGQRTLEISRPLDTSLPFGGCGSGEVPCPGATTRPSADFRGASEDGSVVFFTTTAPLVSSDTDESSDLYMARIGCPPDEPGCEVDERQVTSLVRASEASPPGEAAEVFGMVNLAREGGGGVAYFVAHGALTAVANGEGETAKKGADNLYAYDAAQGKVELVGDVCSGPASSGAVEDRNCPTTGGGSTGLWDTSLWGISGEAQVTDDGRLLVFSSFARLIRKGADMDTDSRNDVYVFDEANGGLQRVSLGEAGFGANGNGDFDASIQAGGYGGNNGFNVATEHEMQSRAVSNDGSWIVFNTAEPLSPRVSNGMRNVFLWHWDAERGEGAVSLISSGSAPTSDVGQAIAPSTSPEGRDVFFMTTAGLARGDTENDIDVYDARLGGGFPQPPVGESECGEDSCHGPLSAPAPLLLPGSVTQAPGGNWPAPAKKAKAKPKQKGKAHHKHRRSRGRRRRHGKRRSSVSAAVRGGLR
jgi:hypothetical protein